MASTDSPLLNAATDAIIVTDENERIDLFNPAAERMFGYRARDVIGDDMTRLIPSPPAGPELSSASDRGDTRGREVRARRSTGELFPAWLSIGEVEEGDRLRIVAVLRDLSGQKAAAARIRSLEARLSRLTRLHLLGELGANMAHELNQPLSAIATYAQAARRIAQSGSPDLHVLADACRKIDEQARRAGRVVHDIRRLVREPQLQWELLEIDQVIDDLAALIETEAAAEDIRVTFCRAARLPRIRGDAIQLQKLVLSLVNNSIEAMREHRGDDRELRIAMTAEIENAARISVTDTGPGVPEALAERVFDPFVTTKEEHAGLGLPTSRAIASAHGGSLGYERGPCGETTFVITLPACGEGRA